MSVPVRKSHQSFYKKSFGFMEFQQMCPKFLDRRTMCLPSVSGQGGLCSHPATSSAGPVHLCWPAGAWACGVGVGCCCCLPLCWHPPSPLLRGRGWLSHALVTSCWGHTTSCLLLVPSLGGFGVVQLALIFFVFARSHCFPMAAWCLAQP